LQKTTNFKGIKICNVPTHNVRAQFFNHYHIVKSDEFRNEIKNWEPEKPIETPYISWYYWPDQFFTFLTQLSVIGLEAYANSAVHYELGMAGRMQENIQYIRNPFSIPGESGTAAKYYKLMPALFSNEISLPECNPQLWEDVKIFYKEIRNPLFHGAQLDTSNVDDLIKIFELIADIYQWIDSWHEPEKIIQGSSWFTNFDRT
jgi:hypothetical protein